MQSASALTHDSLWAELEPDETDLALIDNLLLERGVPLTPLEMAEAVVRHRVEREREDLRRAEQSGTRRYLPSERYEVGQRVIFHRLQNRAGIVVGVRPSTNPDLPSFEVIQVDLDGERREFAANLAKHPLNLNQPIAPEQNGGLDPARVLERYGPGLAQAVDRTLARRPEVVRIAGKWFHRALLAEINEGHLNLAEAVLDVASGGPLPTDDLVQHMEIPAGLDPRLTEFSVDYALQEDERFDEVGPAGKVLWFLRRLEPPEVLETPARLVDQASAYPRGRLSPESIELERELDDELSEVEPNGEPVARELELVLPFPHWAVGSLPLSSRLRPLFPTAYEAPRIRFILVDGHSGAKFPGWVVRAPRYVYGLADWYRRYDVPAGGLLRIRPGERDGEVIVAAVDPRRRNDWIRTATIGEDGRIGLTMLKHPVGTAYDDRRIIGVLDRAALELAWSSSSQRSTPLERLVPQMFRELSKLNPQATVHAEALYAAVNVVKRVPPGPILAELASRAFFEPVGDHYWKLNEERWKEG